MRSRRSDKHYYLVAGTIEFIVSGEVQALSVGDFCLVANGEHLSYRNVSEVPATLCLFHAPSVDAECEVLA